MSTSKRKRLSYPAFIGLAIGGTAFLIASYVAVGVIVDPFNIFHTLGSRRYMSTEQRLAKRAITRDPSYDSFFIGGSMTEEFSIPEFDQTFGAHFAHLTLSGATSFEELNMLKQLPAKHFKYLVMEVYFNSHTADLKATRYDDYPDYLYDHNPYNDFKIYLVFNEFILKELYRAYYWNFKGVNKDRAGYRPMADGYLEWESRRIWNAQTIQENIEAVRALHLPPMRLSTENFEAIMQVAGPQFDPIFLFFPPVHALSLKTRLLEGGNENLKTYLTWKKQIIDITSHYPQAVLIDYQTINPYTIQNENYWDFNHFRSNINQIILADFSMWVEHHHLSQPGFGQVADVAYGKHLSSASLYYPTHDNVGSNGYNKRIEMSSNHDALNSGH